MHSVTIAPRVVSAADVSATGGHPAVRRRPTEHGHAQRI